MSTTYYQSGVKKIENNSKDNVCDNDSDIESDEEEGDDETQICLMSSEKVEKKRGLSQRTLDGRILTTDVPQRVISIYLFIYLTKSIHKGCV